MSKRKYNIDIIRGMMIVFVIIGHGVDLLVQQGYLDQQIGNEIYNWIYTFHMPVLFCISGYVNVFTDRSNQKISSIIKKDIVSLYIPYLFINYAYLFERFFAEKIVGIALNKASDYSLRNMLRLLYNGDSGSWFLLALLCVKIIATILRKYTGKVVCSIVFIACFLLSIIGIGGMVTYYIGWGVFFELGQWLSDVYRKDNYDISNKKITSIFIGSILVTMVGGILFVVNGSNAPTFVDKLLIGGSLFAWLILLTNKWQRVPFISLIGERSMVFYAMHNLSQYIAFIVSKKIITQWCAMLIIMVAVQILIGFLVYYIYTKIKWMNWVEVFFYPWNYWKTRGKKGE